MVLKEDIQDRDIHKICAGEVRFNTEEYIDLISRIQAAQGIITHQPINREKTSIWLVSFLTFMNDYDGGEYVTSSHAISSKIATKDLDNQGSQFVPEMSIRFVEKIEQILDKAETEGYEIRLAPSDSEYIKEDIEGTDEYVEYLKKGVATKTNLSLIKDATDNGLEIMYECIGGCMHPIMKKVFDKLEIQDLFVWNNAEFDPFFHGVGKVMQNPVTKNKEFFDYGCDTTIPEVVKTIGYDKLLESKEEGYIIIMVDPDGDRLVLGQVESSSNKDKLDELGIPNIDLSNDKIFAFYTPNQAFFLIMEFHASQLEKEGIWILCS